MTLKTLYENIEDIPEALREYYKATADGYKLVGLVSEDAYRAKERMALEEKEKFQSLKNKTKEYFGDTPFEEIANKLKTVSTETRQPEGSPDIDKILNAKIQEIKHDYESMIRKKEEALSESAKQSEVLLQQIESFKQRENLARIQDEVRRAGVQMKMRDTAIEDLLELSKLYFSVNDTGSVRTNENQTPLQFLEEIQRKNMKPHWWPDPIGGGAKGATGLGHFEKNPFAPETFNFTECLNFITEKGRDNAQRMANLAGTSLEKLGFR